VKALLQSWRARRLALLLVALPLLLGALYFVVLAQDRYVSTSVVTVRRASGDAMVAGGLASLLGAGSSGSLEDARFLHEYLHSLGLLKKLDAALGLRRHYEQQAGADLFHRLWPQASQEWMLDYWRSRVEVGLDELSGVLTLRVQGFDAAFAQQINQALLAESEGFVNAISQRIAQEQMGFAQTELGRAEDKLKAARGALLAFQTRHQVLDPMAQAQASGTLAAELRAQLAKLEAEISAKRAYLNEDSGDIVALKGQAAALRLQVARETRGATQADQGSINALAAQYQELKAQSGFAEDGYKAALAALESARIEAARKVKSLVVIEPPTQPERAEYPRRLYDLATLLAACGLLYALTRLGLAVINEHRT
jgi:capsular polysaccharide transport system permease protein